MTSAVAAESPAPIASPAPIVSPSGAPESARLVDQVGAAAKAESEALWGRAMEKFAERSFRESAKLFQDYLNRFPGTPEAIDARYNLAQSHLFSKNAKDSIPLFLTVIEIRGRSLLGNEARVYLGQAYLDDSRFTEAFLVSEEILKQEDPGSTTRAKALLLRAHAQAGMKQDSEAEKTLVAFQAVSESDPELERELAGSFLVSLLLKANRCDALPSKDALPEDQLIDQVSRKGVCVLEMGTLLVKASKRFEASELTQAGDTLAASLTTYREACANPPLEKGKRNAKKFLEAKKELRERLQEGCANTEKLLVEALKERENLKSALQKIQSPTVPSPNQKKKKS